jgi:hypothetical protein
MTSDDTRAWRIKFTSSNSRWLIVPGTEADKLAALQVRWQVYCEELGHRWAPSGDPYDQRANLCVVRTPEDQPVASLRIVGPEGRPFEIDRYVPIDDVLPEGSRPAEINRFCILPPFRSISSGVHLALFDFMIFLSRKEFFSHFVLASKPSIAPIYRYLGFEVVRGRSFAHAELANQQHDLMLLELSKLPERYRDARHPLGRFIGSGT